jgi:hypothetical protein
VKKILLTSLVAALAASLAAPALAQSDIDASRKWSWGENVGYMNWRDAGAGAQGVRLTETFLAGYIWGENIGWVTVGDGTPTGSGGTLYTNTTGSDTGVNIAPNGDLYGYAWAENVGWINFDTRAALTPFGQQARLDLASRRLRGYAWGENIGWINLNDASKYVALRCLADYNDDGISDILDLLDFLQDFSACDGQPTPCGIFDPDLDASGNIDVLDFLDFLQAFAAGCP